MCPNGKCVPAVSRGYGSTVGASCGGSSAITPGEPQCDPVANMHRDGTLTCDDFKSRVDKCARGYYHAPGGAQAPDTCEPCTIVENADRLSNACGLVPIGDSTSNTATMEIPPGYVCPSVVDKTNWIGGDDFSHTFEVVQDSIGTTVTVRRTDSAAGWGMNLRFACCELAVTCTGPHDSRVSVGFAGTDSCSVGYHLQPGVTATCTDPGTICSSFDPCEAYVQGDASTCPSACELVDESCTPRQGHGSCPAGCRENGVNIDTIENADSCASVSASGGIETPGDDQMCILSPSPDFGVTPGFCTPSESNVPRCSAIHPAADADYQACAAVTELDSDTACLQVQLVGSDDNNSPACTYHAAPASCRYEPGTYSVSACVGEMQCGSPGPEETAWRMWPGDDISGCADGCTCQEMETGFDSCTDETTTYHAVVMANCPSTCAVSRGEIS